MMHVNDKKAELKEAVTTLFSVNQKNSIQIRKFKPILKGVM